jgi:hypothetical protein
MRIYGKGRPAHGKAENDGCRLWTDAGQPNEIRASLFIRERMQAFERELVLGLADLLENLADGPGFHRGQPAAADGRSDLLLWGVQHVFPCRETFS